MLVILRRSYIWSVQLIINQNYPSDSAREFPDFLVQRSCVIFLFVCFMIPKGREVNKLLMLRTAEKKEAQCQNITWRKKNNTYIYWLMEKCVCAWCLPLCCSECSVWHTAGWAACVCFHIRYMFSNAFRKNAYRRVYNYVRSAMCNLCSGKRNRCSFCAVHFIGIVTLNIWTPARDLDVVFD